MNPINRRDYFAAHAPADIPAWFQHADRTRDPRPVPTGALVAYGDRIVAYWTDDAGIDLADFLDTDDALACVEAVAYQKQIQAWWTAEHARQRENLIGRMAAWRWTWANAMLRAEPDLPAGPTPPDPVPNAFQGKYGRVTTSRKVLHPDEPVFILRATDRQAPGTVEDYAFRCEAAGCDKHHVRSAVERAEHMRAWQAMHPNLVKVRADS